jgi:uncharacterized protein YecE (DUF72 family)
MKVYVGTSGWTYDWNEGKNFQWFVDNSGLNSAELNASFYRFPFANQIKGWTRRCGSIRFAVKVHRKVTHFKKLNEEAVDTWKAFREKFAPLEKNIDFYLFQMPPSFSADRMERVEEFFKSVGAEKKFVIEFRHNSWFNQKMVKKIEKMGIVFASLDSPQIKSFIVNTKRTVYLRFHGREGWYDYNYSAGELKAVAEKIEKAKPAYVYAYFNNNHNMLANARQFLKILREKN